MVHGQRKKQILVVTHYVRVVVMVRWRPHDTVRQWVCTGSRVLLTTLVNVLLSICLLLFNSNNFAGSAALADVCSAECHSS